MSSIKYRAFIKRNDIMKMADEVVGIDFSSNSDLTAVRVRYSANGMSYSNWNFTPEDVILMQYTGMKDKNGNEIYEGDILKCEKLISIFGPTYTTLRGRVTFFQSCFCLKLNAIRDIYLLLELKNLEVIGNIYEKPELLEVKE